MIIKIPTNKLVGKQELVDDKRVFSMNMFVSKVLKK